MSLKEKVASKVSRPLGQTGLEAVGILLLMGGYNMAMNSPDIESKAIGVVFAVVGLGVLCIKYVVR